MTDIVNNSSKSAQGGEMAPNPQTAAAPVGTGPLPIHGASRASDGATAATIAPEGIMTRNASVGEGSALSQERADCPTALR